MAAEALHIRSAVDRNQRILLARRPSGLPAPEDFATDTTAIPTPGPGQFLARTIYLSLDPYYCDLMQDPAGSLLPGDLMPGETVSQILESRHPDYRPGEYVLTRNGWQQYALSSGQGVRRLDPAVAPISTALGVLGIPGLAGYAGIVYIGTPRPGETVVVSAATGPVGCTAGQVARLVGARPVGIAGTDEKCAYAVEELGYADCINYKRPDFAAELRRACPDGIDVYFDNVGGEILATVLACLAPKARIVLCGTMDSYRSVSPLPGPTLRPLISARATMTGLVVDDYLDRLPVLVRVVGAWIQSGQFRYREDVTDGLENAPAAFCRLMRGENFGKALVRVGPEHLGTPATASRTGQGGR
ncbi:MAG: NADP-dependent oxidoreductase [Pseudomonadota bacterium]|jgi:Putative NADP-dependent oxidoreductases|nr:MAG: NADP-dependent oxidoreductase [Pseudomonadota bacterium]